MTALAHPELAIVRGTVFLDTGEVVLERQPYPSVESALTHVRQQLNDHPGANVQIFAHQGTITVPRLEFILWKDASYQVTYVFGADTPDENEFIKTYAGAEELLDAVRSILARRILEHV